jgi:hypothetical protein
MLMQIGVATRLLSTISALHDPKSAFAVAVHSLGVRASAGVAASHVAIVSTTIPAAAPPAKRDAGCLRSLDPACSA